MELVKYEFPFKPLVVAPLGDIEAIRIHDIAWLAGLLEGEGCFSIVGRSVVIELQMTDKDVVEHAAQLLNTPVYVNKKKPNRKMVWRLHLHGNRAAGWMMTLYSLMGLRRRGRIKELLTGWRLSPTKFTKVAA